MVDELHERAADGAADAGAREEQVEHREQRDEQHDDGADEHLQQRVAAAPQREAHVPHGHQHLLTVRVGHKLPTAGDGAAVGTRRESWSVAKLALGELQRLGVK